MYGVLLELQYNGPTMEHIDGFATMKAAEDFGKKFVGMSASRRYYVYESVDDPRKKLAGNFVELNWTEDELKAKVSAMSSQLSDLVERMRRNPLTMPAEMSAATIANMIAADMELYLFKDKQDFQTTKEK